MNRIHILLFPRPEFPARHWLASLVMLSLMTGGCNAQPQNSSATDQEQAVNFAAAPSADKFELVAGPWQQWRGPNGNGVVIDQTPPTEWSDTKNVIWKTKVPGLGHASPTVVGNQIILATSNADDETQSVVSFDMATGNEIWNTLINEGNFNPQIFPTNTHASSTVASDGTRLFALFNNNESAQLAALDLKGEVLWKKKVAEFKPKRYQFGFGSSPVIYGDLVIIASECERDGSMAAFNCVSGEEVWRVSRGSATSYSTPAIATVAGKRQLIMSGGKSVVAYNPATGEELWNTTGPWTVTCGTAVWSDEMVFVSGGFPAQRTMGINADGSGEIVWENTAKCYEQSMLYHDGYLYGLADTGVCYCWRASDGEEMWKQRMEKKVSASPVLAGGNIYISVESGKTFVFRADPTRFELVAENQLENMAYATPAFVDNKILARVADVKGNDKQEWLYCLGDH